MSDKIRSSSRLIHEVTFLMLLMPFATAWGAGPSQAGKAQTAGKFSDLVSLLPDPGSEYRPAPLWVWNADMKRSDVDRALTEFKDKGFGGAFIHPRAGLTTEYLSDEWFGLYRHSVDKAKELGLEIWIYDENSYPSGFAGGHVPAQMPESYNQGSGLVPVRDSLVSEKDSKYFICLKGNPDGTFTDITENLPCYYGVKGDYFKYRKSYYARTPWYGGYSYIDLLMPGVTEKFLEVTMKGYESVFGKDLGKELKGLFSDEPHIGTHGGTRWTPYLFNEFEKRWGYDLKTRLPFLSEERGECGERGTDSGWRRVRHNYMSTLTRLFIDRWARPMEKYCRDHNLIWTGHYWEHDWPRLSKGGDSMAMYAHHQMPAIDMLFNQFNDSAANAQFGNVRSVRELQSVAAQTGKPRTLCETYGGGGWDETFEDFKRLGDWEYALGVNYLCQHLSHTTIRGARKYDYPPVFSPVSPWWESYRTLNDYFSRLSLLLSHGRRNADVLILEPTTTIWTYYSYLTPMKGSMTRKIGQNFQDFLTQVEKNNIEYDLGSELVMEDYGSASAGSLTIGEASYHTVVIPPMTENLNSATFDLLKRFAADGGEIIACSIPTLIDGAESDELSHFFARNTSRINTEVKNADDLSALLTDRQKARIVCPGIKDLYHNRRRFDDGELLFLANSSLEEDAVGEIAVPGRSVFTVDPMTGTVSRTASRKEGSDRKVEFSIPPAGSLTLFFCRDEKADRKLSAMAVKSRKKNSAASLPSKSLEANGLMEIAPDRDNILLLDFCRFTSHGRESEELYYAVACDSLFARHGMKNPWDSSIQYRCNTLDGDTLHAGSVSVRYSFISDTDGLASPVSLTQEFPDIWKVRINGEKVEPNGGYIIDPRFGSYDISRHIRKGKNEIELYADSMSIFTEIAPLYITGRFRLESIPEGWKIVPSAPLTAGSWKAQGYPCYPWGVDYSKRYDIIKDKGKSYILKLGEWMGTVAEVFVNGKKAATVFSPPYEADLTPFLTNGLNRITVRIIGSNLNLYGPHYGREKGLAAPPNWKKVSRRKSGKDYDQADYGLISGFELYIE